MTCGRAWRLARLLILGLLVAGGVSAGEPVTPPEEPTAVEPSWQPLGLLRVRDMTPFGILRLDMLPAHPVAAPSGSWALEVNLTWQNTHVMSGNVEDLLEARGGRAALSPDDVGAILALPRDAYLVDGEFGLFDLTVHHWFDEHWSAYATVPYYDFSDGFLDRTIEDFHGSFGLGNAARDLLERDDFVVVARVGDVSFVMDEPPRDGFGDPVLGARYVARAPGRSYLVLEAAAKLAVGGDGRFTTTGSNDYGVQLSWQRPMARGALYASLAAVLYDEPIEVPESETLVPTLIAGYEHRLSRRSSGIVQLYASPSVVQDTDAAELADDKYQVSIGWQTWRGRTAFRIGITENVSNFANTPDIGITLQAGTLLGRR